MNIGIVTNWSHSGATEVSITFLKSISELGRLFAYGRDEEFLPELKLPGVQVHRGKFSGSPFPKAIDKRDFQEWLRVHEIEVLIFNEQIWIPPVIWAKQMGIKTVGYVDYYNERSVPDFIVYDALIVNTKRHLSVFSWHPQCWYLPWGLNLSSLNGSPTDFSDYRKTDFFHSAGSSPRRRGTDLVLKAMNEIDFGTLTVHSTVGLAELLPEMREVIDVLVADGKLQLIEKSQPLPGYYKLGSVYLYPNRLDGIGLTIVEAMGHGLPVVCPDESPMNEFVSSKTGFLLPVVRRWSRRDGYFWPLHEVSLDSLREAMLFVLKNKQLIDTKSSESRKAVKECFNMEINYAKLATLISNMQTFQVSNSRYADIIQSAEYSEFVLKNRFLLKVITVGNRLKKLVSKI